MNMPMPKLDYLLQYPVTKIWTPADGEEDKGQWAIEFENGATVTNYDPGLEAPSEDIVGTALLTTLYSAGETRLRFGISRPGGVTTESVISLNPAEYAIVDPRFDQGEPHFPQRVESAEAAETRMATIREQFESRAVEAPEAQPDAEAPENVVEQVEDANQA